MPGDSHRSKVVQPQIDSSWHDAFRMTSPPTVLIVDDEPDVIDALQQLLEPEYRVRGAIRANDGLDILGSEDVHVVLTDQWMPDMTGVEFLHRVRREHPDATRLLFTGQSDTGAVIDAINRGSVYRYITKPCEAVELLSIVREAAERHDM